LFSSIVYLGVAGCRTDAGEEKGTSPQTRESPKKSSGQKIRPSASTKKKEKGDRKMAKFEITSTAFAFGHAIPKKHTGEGADVSPPLQWNGLPEGTKELVLICDDPDAPTDEPWVHWVIYKIPITAKGLHEGVPRRPRLKEPSGSMQGKNSWTTGDVIGYRGPFPPPGHGTHHYYFKLYALEAQMVVEPGLEKKAVLADISEHIIGEAVLMGTYER
jgi:Raf kinase inhibitor-like YbhB/YbcL family protein